MCLHTETPKSGGHRGSPGGLYSRVESIYRLEIQVHVFDFNEIRLPLCSWSRVFWWPPPQKKNPHDIHRGFWEAMQIKKNCLRQARDVFIILLGPYSIYAPACEDHFTKSYYNIWNNLKYNIPSGYFNTSLVGWESIGNFLHATTLRQVHGLHFPPKIITVKAGHKISPIVQPDGMKNIFSIEKKDKQVSWNITTITVFFITFPKYV